jgi:hypothetical protein
MDAEKDIIIILKNGLQFYHDAPQNETQEEFEEFTSGIFDEFSKEIQGILQVTNPYGIYKYSDISGVIFTKRQPVKGRIGF